jgi:hypothetical protein
MSDLTRQRQQDGTRFIHRLIHARYGITKQTVLNDGPIPAAMPEPMPIARDLLRIMNLIKGEVFGEAGQQVDYTRLQNSPVYDEYQRCARLLHTFDPDTLSSRGEKLAFWINLYNALLIDAVIQYEVKASVNDLPGFFWRIAYRVGGYRYSAFDIEYGILRANASHPAIPGPQFGANDPRRSFILAQRDPRVHFALVCAARSCPPIGVYEPERIDDQLDLATKSFINGGGVEIDRDAREVRLSKIFQWYAPDFGGMPLGLGDKRPLLSFVSEHLLEEVDRAFVLDGAVRVRFQDYDWTLNIAGKG